MPEKMTEALYRLFPGTNGYIGVDDDVAATIIIPQDSFVRTSYASLVDMEDRWWPIPNEYTTNERIVFELPEGIDLSNITVHYLYQSGCSQHDIEERGSYIYITDDTSNEVISAVASNGRMDDGMLDGHVFLKKFGDLDIYESDITYHHSKDGHDVPDHIRHIHNESEKGGSAKFAKDSKEVFSQDITELIETLRNIKGLEINYTAAERRQLHKQLDEANKLLDKIEEESTNETLLSPIDLETPYNFNEVGPTSSYNIK